MLRPDWTSEDGSIVLYNRDCTEVVEDSPDNAYDVSVTDAPYGVEAADWDGKVPYRIAQLLLCICSKTVMWFGSGRNLIEDARSFVTPPDRMLAWAPKYVGLSPKDHGFSYRFHPIWCWRLRDQTACDYDIFDDMTEGHVTLRSTKWWSHPCSKPLSLMRKLVLSSSLPHEVVFDPFAGTSPLGVACVQAGRRYVGVESNPEYFKIAVQRIERSINDIPLFCPEKMFSE